MTPAAWAALTDDERRHMENTKLAEYASETLHNIAQARHTSRDLHEPYVAHGCWYVRVGSVEIPFTNYADACAFITAGHKMEHAA